MAPAQEERIPIKSAADLAYYFQTIQDALAEKETEDSWQRLDRALAKLEAVAKGGGYKFDEFVYHMKSVAEPLTSAVSRHCSECRCEGKARADPRSYIAHSSFCQSVRGFPEPLAMSLRR